MNLLQLLAFDRWANAESLRAVRFAGIPDKALAVFSHIVAIQEFWLARVTGGSLDTSWPEWSLDEAERHFLQAYAAWRGMVEDDAQSPRGLMEYTAANSRNHSTTLAELVIELVTHGAHHRGQIALLLRQAGHEPPSSTDFIPALRARIFSAEGG